MGCAHAQHCGLTWAACSSRPCWMVLGCGLRPHPSSHTQIGSGFALVCFRRRGRASSRFPGPLTAPQPAPTKKHQAISLPPRTLALGRWGLAAQDVKAERTRRTKVSAGKGEKEGRGPRRRGGGSEHGIRHFRAAASGRGAAGGWCRWDPWRWGRPSLFAPPLVPYTRRSSRRAAPGLPCGTRAPALLSPRHACSGARLALGTAHSKTPGLVATAEHIRTYTNEQVRGRRAQEGDGRT